MQNSMKSELEKVCSHLQNRDFEAKVFASGDEASRAILQKIAPGSTVGIGGSVTIQTLHLSDKLRKNGCTVYWHWESDDPQVARKAAFESDYYLLSANALDADGVIYNIDGTGNRIAATIFGPAKVFMIIGRNKLAQNETAALERIKEVTCPQNARRLALKTPCAITGHCTDCRSPQRMCAATMKLERRPFGKPEFSILLVDEDLGY